MPTTAGGIRYPASSASINIPGDLQNLAEDVETYITANAVTTTGTFTLTNKTITSPIINGDGVVFEGATADAFETTLTVADPTADRTITLPNVNGTVITTGNLSDITDIGVFTGSITIEGTTADGFETTLQVADPTADRTVTFQDATGTVVLRDTTDTLTNKTLTAPRFADSGFIADANGNELISFPSTVASAVNQVLIENAATGDGVTTGQPTIRAQGNDTNISLNLVPKGSGVVQANGVAVVTTSGTQTLTNKTLTSPVISTISNTGTLTLPTTTGTLALQEDLEIMVIMAAF